MERKETWIQTVPEGMSELDILEGYNQEQLLDYKSFLLEKYSDIERNINLVNYILDGYGHDYSEEDNVVLGES